MKPDSVRSFKLELSDEVIRGEVGIDPVMSAFYESTDRPYPAGAALGISVREDGEHVVAIRSADPALAAAIASRARGEADVRIVPSVDARVTTAWLQSRQRPLRCGLQIGMQSKNTVGTLGCFVRDLHAPEGSKVLYALTNSHVAADGGKAQLGSFITQPGKLSSDIIGVLDRFVPYSGTSPNIVDVALVRISSKLEVVSRHSYAIGEDGGGGDISGARDLSVGDLGSPVAKVGRTTAVQRGKITVVEMDNLPVNMGNGFIPTFSDQFEISGGPAVDFSAPGDSGSLIVDADGWAVGLLFAGGRDNAGEDRTYANRIREVLARAGARLA